MTSRGNAVIAPLVLVLTGPALWLACGSTQPAARQPRAWAQPTASVSPSSLPGGASEQDAGPGDAGARADDGVVLKWPEKLETRGWRFQPTVAITRDGSRVAATLQSPDAVGGVAVVVWDGVTGGELRRLTVDAETLAFDSNDNLVMTADGTLQVLPPAADAQARKRVLADGIVRVSPDGAWVVTLGGRPNPRDLLVVSLQDAATVLVPIKNFRPDIRSVAFAPDSTRLCVVTNNSGGDLPSGRTQLIVFDLVAGRGWTRTASRAVGAAQQDNSALMLSRERVWLDDHTIDLASGSVSEPPAPLEPMQIAVGGRTVLFDNGTGARHQIATLADGRFDRWTTVHRPRATADRGHAAAVSARGHVVWCARSSCVVGPPLL